MVLLTFKVRISATIDEVWNYYSNFANLHEWDPNIRKVKLITEKDASVGT